MSVLSYGEGIADRVASENALSTFAGLTDVTAYKYELPPCTSQSVYELAITGDEFSLDQDSNAAGVR